ncbi:methionine aminopeptidase 1D, mitochondrial isoform X1 [Drosophila novamexicana]|uniref:methionine aminopeptidase 1D, mitochondrial isoform X1 n=1 Tax=Drosophila novamexicana TaxID=47314 RepID=UPI0011E5F2A3|nr:methionine aminopeptidase 1D, mitochondrial isoform X1 [Drosophila novamexicana]
MTQILVLSYIINLFSNVKLLTEVKFSNSNESLYCRDKGKWELISAAGKVSNERNVPEHIQKPPYYYKEMPAGNTLGTPEIKNEEQLNHMRSCGKLAAQILRECGKMAKVGITTDHIDDFAHQRIISENAYPSPLRYVGFPKSLCTSINNVACHGIPDDRPLADGDIINIDVTVYQNGCHGDCSETFLVGHVDERGRFLVDSTRECLEKCIALCGPGVPFNEIGKYIQKYCQERDLESVEAFIGHGIGSYFHGPPEIYHYANEAPGRMQAGMTFTIEPILSLGSGDIGLLEDGWTAVSLDNSRSAQFEHTILITATGVEVLTNAV